MRKRPDSEELLQTLAARLSDTTLSSLFPDYRVEAIRAALIGLAEELKKRSANSVQPSNSSAAGKTEPLPKQHRAPRGTCRLYTDGASRGNPGRAGAGIVLLDDSDRELTTKAVYLGTCTNNVAEYRALLIGLQAAREEGCRRVEIFMDSELIVRQLQGRYQVKSAALKPLFTEVRQLLHSFDSWKVLHVPRAQNRRADELANQGIDNHQQLQGA
ncbi:ribonuclease HI family protein [Desulfolithobacter sp.]